MTPVQFLATAMLLGIFAAFGGAYAVLSAIGTLRRRPELVRAGRAAYAVQGISLLLLLVWSPLASLWKIFLLVSCAAYFVIPPLTLRYLARLHDPPGVPR
jgi:uncharacterized membrane protein HdeD (DUF308 family)